MNPEMKRGSPSSTDLESRLDAALARALAPPAVPAGLRRRVSEAMLQEAGAVTAEVMAARLRELEAEHDRELARLRRESVRASQPVLGLIVLVSFATGLIVDRVLPELQMDFGVPLQSAAPWMGVLAGLGAAVAVWFGNDLRRFGQRVFF